MQTIEWEGWGRRTRETKKPTTKRIEWKEEKSALKHWYGVLESSFNKMQQHLYSAKEEWKKATTKNHQIKKKHLTWACACASVCRSKANELKSPPLFCQCQKRLWVSLPNQSAMKSSFCATFSDDFSSSHSILCTLHDSFFLFNFILKNFLFSQYQ